MERIASFTINHMNLFPGLYVSRKDKKEDCIITTFEIPANTQMLFSIRMNSFKSGRTHFFLLYAITNRKRTGQT